MEKVFWAWKRYKTMKTCEICNESSLPINFSTDIRMNVCDECLIEMVEFISLMSTELIKLEGC